MSIGLGIAIASFAISGAAMVINGPGLGGALIGAAVILAIVRSA